jgi:SAM-dependent methyltransferase
MFLRYQNAKFQRRSRVEDPSSVTNKVWSDEYLKITYREILDYQLSLSCRPVKDQVIVELGSAGGITKLLYPGILTTDVRIQEGVDYELNMDFSLPFMNESVDCIVAKDVLHHISDAQAHFLEVERVLKIGGSVIYADPNWNVVSKLVFTFLHPEVFDDKQVEWKFHSPDPMYSNQAIPWIIFVRDLEVFNSLNPQLKAEILSKRMNGLSFLLSGGVMNRSLIPSRVLLQLRSFESSKNLLMAIFGTIRFIQVTKIK